MNTDVAFALNLQGEAAMCVWTVFRLLLSVFFGDTVL